MSRRERELEATRHHLAGHRPIVHGGHDLSATPAPAAIERPRIQGDVAVAAVAARQHGVITSAQLADCGLGRGAVHHRVQQGRLHRVHHGVYLVGHPLPVPFAAEMAAVLACGPGAVISHLTAARIWGLYDGAPRDAPIDVTMVGRNAARRPGIRRHRSSSFAEGDVRQLHQIPVLSPARTILNLAATNPAVLERAIAEAERRRLIRRDELTALVARLAPQPGIKAMRKLLAQGNGPSFTRSEAEARLLRLIRAANLPTPETNVRIAGYEVDVLWRAERLIVEVDGFAFHASRDAFERDRRRDADLQARGWRVMRVTWRQLVDERDAALVRLAQALAVR